MADLPAAFVAAVEAERVSLNARFVLRLRGGSHIDGGEFLQHLEQRVAPLVGQVHKLLPERSREVVVALYDISLDLFSVSLLGPDAKLPWVEQVWESLLPTVPQLLARQPQQVAGCLCNAAFQIASQAGARPQQWLERMGQVAPSCQSVAELLEVGKVLAWQAGMVQYRAAALAAVGVLRAPLSALVLGLPAATPADDIATAIDRLRRRAWLTAEAALSGRADPGVCCTGIVGAFSGLGGLFLRPPTVRTDEGSLLVSDGRSQWRLLADAYGVWFQRVPEPAAQRATKPDHPDVSIDRRGAIRWGSQSLVQSHLANASSFACDGQTLAITIPTSHHIFLFADPALSS